MAHNALAFFFSRLLALYRLVKALKVVIHGFPLWSFNSSEGSQAEDVPIRADQRRLPSLVLHNRGLDEGA